MWQVENSTPFEALGNWVRDRDGAEVWLVAVRGTFQVFPDGTTAVAKEQAPPLLAPEFFGDPANSSLRYDSDFQLTKPATDVLLHGHAYAPGGKAATRFDVTLRVGDIVKTLRITGDRIFERGVLGIAPGSAQACLRMPIVYERAFGGREPDPPADPDRPRFDLRNPVGTGFCPRAGALATNIEYPSGGDRPAGFGPIPPHWQPRLGFAGTYDETWREQRMPLYPSDLDERFFLSSPEDQRPKSFLRGGERVDLINLDPSGRMSFMLPRVAMRFESVFRGKRPIVHRANLHTVILEPDRGCVVMVWHSALRAHIDVTRLQQTLITQLQMLNSAPGSTPAQEPVYEDE